MTEARRSIQFARSVTDMANFLLEKDVQLVYNIKKKRKILMFKNYFARIFIKLR